MQNRFSESREQAIEKLNKLFNSSESSSTQILRKELEIKISEEFEEEKNVYIGTGEKRAKHYRHLLKLNPHLINKRKRTLLQQYNAILDEEAQALEEQAQRESLLYSLPKEFLDDTNHLSGLVTTAAIAILTIGSATQAGLLVSAKTASDAVSSILDYALPIVLVSMAIGGITQSIEAMCDNKTEAQGITIAEGLIRSGLSSTAFASAPHIGLLALPPFALPLLFLGIILAGVIKEEAQLLSVRKKMTALEANIKTNQEALNERITHIGKKFNLENDITKDNIIRKDPEAIRLATIIARDQKELSVLQIKEESLVKSRNITLAVGLISIGLLIAAAAFPPLSLGAAILTTLGLAVFFGLSRYINHHKLETNNKVQEAKHKSLKQTEVLEIALKNKDRENINKPKTVSIFETVSYLFSKKKATPAVTNTKNNDYTPLPGGF
jgi:hypothetical protein